MPVLLHFMAREISATDLSRNLSKILDDLEFRGGEIVIVRNKYPIARMIARSSQMTALEAMSDLFRTLPEDAAESWVAQGKELRNTLSGKVNDPWDS